MTARELAPGPTSSPSGASSHGPGSSPGEAGSGVLAEKYRTLFVLGRGGMGAVEAALELRGEGGGYERVVALKRLLPERRDARRVEMFLREAKLATMLDHPNVVRAHAYGEIGGELYLALEYVEGQPLSRVLGALAERGETMPIDLAVHVVAEVCEGLHAAHELRGEGGQLLAVVHRDVSPQNVMIGYDGVVRLLDFGIAKVEAESVTKTGEVKGKTAYMSPEQAMGDPLDRRSDLFGVGALLFECIAGRRMWGPGTDMDVIRKLALESPPALAEASAEVAEDLAELFGKLVAREPAARPATASQVASALRAHAGGSDATARREALASLLARHFAEDAHAERDRLAGALDEAAPSQANALRESLVPLPESTTAAPREVEAPAHEAEGETTAPAKSVGRGPLVAAFVVAIAIAGALALRSPPSANADATASATATAPPPPVPIPSAMPSATPSASASASADPTPPRPAPLSASAPARPRPLPPVIAATATPSVPSSRPSPTASAKPPPPPDVDEKPF